MEIQKLKIEGLDPLLETRTSTLAKDLRLNLKRVLSEGSLDAAEAGLALLATAASVDMPSLVTFAQGQLKQLDFSDEQIREAAESAAIMAMLNTYYRFRHMIGESEDYRSAGLRMTALAKPHLGKERFEMLAFAVSILNGCESCVRSHEKVLREAGVNVEKIHDLARLASIVKAWKTLSTLNE